MEEWKNKLLLTIFLLSITTNIYLFFLTKTFDEAVQMGNQNNVLLSNEKKEAVGVQCETPLPIIKNKRLAYLPSEKIEARDKIEKEVIVKINEIFFEVHEKMQGIKLVTEIDGAKTFASDFFEKNDINHDGILEYDEFVSHIEAIAPFILENYVGNDFFESNWDFNNLKDEIKNRGISLDLPEVEDLILEKFALSDTNFDGSLDKYEKTIFYNYIYEKEYEVSKIFNNIIMKYR